MSQESERMRFPGFTAAEWNLHNLPKHMKPPALSGSSGDQTWLAGKWTIEIGDFPMTRPLNMGFSAAMFDYQRVIPLQMGHVSMHI